MCDVCLRTPCHSRCPNAPEPPVAYICADCGDRIHSGEKYNKVEERYYCDDCVETGIAELEEF